MFSRGYRNISKRCYTYSDILLKTFIEISNTGNLGLLLKKGKTRPEILAEVWEGIITENSKANNISDFNNNISELKSYHYLSNEFLFIRATLIKLLMDANDEDIKELRKRGYFISEDQEKYFDSVLMALRKCDNLKTKIEMKRKELERNNKSSDKSGKVEYVDLIASLEMSLGRQVEDNITLSKYNSLCKFAKRKHEQEKKALSNKHK